jgi:hypothetical protein
MPEEQPKPEPTESKPEEVTTKPPVEGLEEETPASETPDEQAPLSPEAAHEAAAEESKDLFAADKPQSAPVTGGKFKRFGHWYKTHKKLSIPLTVLFVVVLLMVIPFTRYKVLGLFWKQTITVSVKDSKTNQPITEATVAVAGKTGTTGNNGSAQVSSVPVGPHEVLVTKKYYADTKKNITVPLMKSKTSFDVQLQATGRQVPVVIKNKVSSKPVENVLVKTNDTQARTDKDGKVVVVVPADQTKVKISISADSYNSQDAELTVTEDSVAENNFQIVPAGKVYFLSKLSGKVDVVKTNLDGSQRQVVLAGTGKEETADTILLASRDWKYLALKSKRDGGKAKLFLIDTSNDKLTTMDEGDANFTMNGWSDHRFIFTVSRNNVQYWADKQVALKSYNAEDKHLAVLDETHAVGPSQYNYAAETLGNVYIVQNKILYTKVWTNYNYPADIASRKSTIITVDNNGQNKAGLKEYPSSEAVYVSSIDAKAYEPNEIYYAVYFVGKANEFLEYASGKVAAASDVNESTFNKPYPTYLISPSGKQAFWAEARDGKNTLFVGDSSGANEKQIATLSEYTPYGWYTDDYLFVSKSGSELYILPKAGTTEGASVTKVTDYHKPSADFTGYGGGYGGF